MENKNKLFSCAMKGEWDEVIKMCKQDASLHRARITRSGNTVLHIAVSEGKEKVVKQMLHLISQIQADNKDKFIIQALRTPNERNNTALHLAASMGNATICRVLASENQALVDDRNNDGETPLFLAALHGRKNAFLCLHCIRNPNMSATIPPFYDNCRRNNGDTILHCAIKGNYFDLAFQIIHLYKDLANLVNEEGLSPLHLLASKPCDFKSGSRLGRMETIIYRCIHIDKLKPENLARHEHQMTHPHADKDSDSHYYPPNYNTLWDFSRLIRKAVTTVLRNPDVQEERLSKPVEQDAENPEVRAGGSQVDIDQANALFPANYRTCCHFIKFFYLLHLIFWGKGHEELKKIYRKKETHTWSIQIVKLLLDCASSYQYEVDGRKPHEEEGYSTPLVKPTSSTNVNEGEQLHKMMTTETPILVASKNGVIEIIEKIVELFPVAIHDLNEDKKNMVLLAVEHRETHVYEFLLKKNIYKESLFHQVDKDGNNALHLAAALGDHKPWRIPGEALQMQWELKWFNFVKEAMPHDFFCRHNNNYETPEDVFTKTHKKLGERASEWLYKTSESCSLVAALIASVAFATSATVPGGVVQETGHPTLKNEVEFQLFAISALIALGCSITALVMFLSILTSRFQEQDFNKSLPRKLRVGLITLFMSIASMLVSFCAGHFFLLKDTLHYLALPIYLAACLPAFLFVLAQFPLYFDLLLATFKDVPQRSHKSNA